MNTGGNEERVELFRKSKGWHIRLCAPNNEIRLSSEVYSSKSNAMCAAIWLAHTLGFWQLRVVDKKQPAKSKPIPRIRLAKRVKK